MKNAVVIGAQWGDEGKAKIVDILSEKADVVVRYQGGANAGHTVVKEDRKFIFHLVPTGMLHPGKMCVIGNGAVIDIEALLREIGELEQNGLEVRSRLLISGTAHVVLPFHKVMDSVMEDDLGEGKRGTTKRGIGPAYADKISRIGVRIAELFDVDVLRDRLKESLRYKNTLLQHLFHQEPIRIDDVLAYCQNMAEQIKGMVTNTTQYLHQAIGQDKRVLFEGAQGTLLDVDFGTYPYLTSSNPCIGGVFSGTGINPWQIQDIIGVVKAYQTRVGTGPFPTELTDTVGNRLREVGGEYGATTGRPRRCGWLDLVALKYAVQVNGFNQIALTKMDILDKFDRIYVCTHYRYRGESIDFFPQLTSELVQCEPVYEEHTGWDKPMSSLTEYADLPEKARAFIARIEEAVQIRVTMISTGARRSEIIWR